MFEGLAKMTCDGDNTQNSGPTNHRTRDGNLSNNNSVAPNLGSCNCKSVCYHASTSYIACNPYKSKDNAMYNRTHVNNKCWHSTTKNKYYNNNHLIDSKNCRQNCTNDKNNISNNTSTNIGVCKSFLAVALCTMVSRL